MAAGSGAWGDVTDGGQTWPRARGAGGLRKADEAGTESPGASRRQRPRRHPDFIRRKQTWDVCLASRIRRE